MSFQLKKALLPSLVLGLCLSLQAGANAQDAAETFSVAPPAGIATRPLDGIAVEAPARTAESAPSATAATSTTSAPQPPQPQNLPAPIEPAAVIQGQVRMALLLPMRSPALGSAAEAVRAGFLAAHAVEPQNVEVTLIETGDAPADVVAGYRRASAASDLVVGPLTRSGVTALARSGEVMRPTIALTTPEFAEGSDVQMPGLMLAMGLSIEDEARQVAEWARRDEAGSTAYIVHTPVAWQKRAARAFAAYWTGKGLPVRTIELALTDGFLNANAMQGLRARLDGEASAFLFVALDAGQARQLRESVGRRTMYGTSQLNPVALPDRVHVSPVPEMDGARLLDIPWQLDAEHPIVMTYPRLSAPPDQRRSADMERLYALGIDAYRVARELAARHTNFELDGVTGRLRVRFDRNGPYFARAVQQAVYRDGSVVAEGLPN